MDNVRKDTNIFRSSYLDQTWNFITIQVWDKTPSSSPKPKRGQYLILQPKHTSTSATSYKKEQIYIQYVLIANITRENVFLCFVLLKARKHVKPDPALLWWFDQICHREKGGFFYK